MIESKFLEMGMKFIAEQEIIQSELKQRAIDEYNAALKLPRKKKKQAKKSALLLYSIVCWEPRF